MNDTIAVFASARRNGNTGNFIDWIGSGLGVNIIDLSEKNISPYDYDHKNLDDDFISIMNEILNYEKIIFATPVYWYAASAQMKIFIDRMSDFLDLDELKDIGRRLRKKTGYIVCTSASSEADSAFLGAFKSTFEYLGMNYGGHIHADCENGYIPDEYMEDVTQFLKLVKFSDCLSEKK